MSCKNSSMPLHLPARNQGHSTGSKYVRCFVLFSNNYPGQVSSPAPCPFFTAMGDISRVTFTNQLPDILTPAYDLVPCEEPHSTDATAPAQVAVEAEQLKQLQEPKQQQDVTASEPEPQAAEAEREAAAAADICMSEPAPEAGEIPVDAGIDCTGGTTSASSSRPEGEKPASVDAGTNGTDHGPRHRKVSRLVYLYAWVIRADSGTGSAPTVGPMTEQPADKADASTVSCPPASNTNVVHAPDVSLTQASTSKHSTQTSSVSLTALSSSDAPAALPLAGSATATAPEAVPGKQRVRVVVGTRNTTATVDTLTLPMVHRWGVLLPHQLPPELACQRFRVWLPGGEMATAQILLVGQFDGPSCNGCNRGLASSSCATDSTTITTASNGVASDGIANGDARNGPADAGSAGGVGNVGSSSSGGGGVNDGVGGGEGCGDEGDISVADGGGCSGVTAVVDTAATAAAPEGGSPVGHLAVLRAFHGAVSRMLVHDRVKVSPWRVIRVLNLHC